MVRFGIRTCAVLAATLILASCQEPLEELFTTAPTTPVNIILSPGELTLVVGASQTVTATTNPELPPGTDFIWSRDANDYFELTHPANLATRATISCVKEGRFGSFTVRIGSVPTATGGSGTVNCVAATDVSTPPPSTPPTPPTPPALTGITLTPSAVAKIVGEREVIRIGFLPANFTGTVKIHAALTNGDIAVIASSSELARTIEIECVGVGTTRLIVVAEGLIGSEFVSITCTALPTVTVPPPIAPPTPPVLTGLTLTPSDVVKGVLEREVIRVGFLPANFTGTVKINAEVLDSAIAVIASNNQAARTIEIECVAVGRTRLIVAAENTGASEFAGITCTALPTVTVPPPTAPPNPPPTAPTTDSIVGTYDQQGTRLPGSTCNPPVFQTPFNGAALMVERSASANLGIRLVASHGTVVLPYSELTQTTSNGVLRLSSGTPTRSIGGTSYDTHLLVEFTPDGRFTGTETFTSRTSPPCTDTYRLEGRRR